MSDNKKKLWADQEMAAAMFVEGLIVHRGYWGSESGEQMSGETPYFVVLHNNSGQIVAHVGFIDMVQTKGAVTWGGCDDAGCDFMWPIFLDEPKSFKKTCQDMARDYARQKTGWALCDE